MAEDPKKKAEDAAKALKDIGEITGALEDGFRELTSRLTDIVDEIKEGSIELTNFNNITRDITRSIRSMSKINEDLIKNQVALNNRKLTTKQVDEQINKVEASRIVLTSRLSALQSKINDEAGATAAQKKELITLELAIREVSQEVAERFKEQRIEAEKLEISIININKSLGLAGNILKGAENLLNKLGLGALNNVINFKQINQQLQTQANLLTNNGQNILGFSGKVKIAGNAVKLLGIELFKSLSDPLVIGGLLITLFKKLIEAGFKADTQVTNLSKSMAISKNEATLIRDRFIEIQNSGDSLFETTQNLVAAQLELADAFGTTRGFTERQVRDQVYLTKQIGLSVDEAKGLQQLAMANGLNADQLVNSTIKQTAALARQTGIQLDNKKILGDIAKVSGQIRLQYQNNPELIAAAVIQTQKLGINLEQAAKMSEHLLNFEESIGDQIAAELLTGKDLNLEKARLLALNGDIAGAGAEILRQVGSAAEFSALNIVQQQALAKAVGMTTDELANSLVQQQNLNNLGASTRQQVEDQIAAAKKLGDVNKVRMLENSIGNEAEAKAALDRIDAQTKFNLAIEKVQSMIANLVDGPMGRMLDKIISFISNTAVLKTILVSIAAIMAGMAVSMASTAIAWAIMNPIGALVGLGVAAAVGAAVALSDGAVDSKGLVVGSYNKGQITPIAQGAADDNVIFTTNKPTSSPAGGNASIDVGELVRRQDKTNDLLDKLLNKESSIYTDSTKTGTATHIGTYKIQ